jgi:hypothetical protein
MAVRLTGRGVTSTNFSKPLFAVSGAMGAWKSRRESNSRREFDQLQEIAGEDSRDQGLSFLFFCRSHAVSSPHGVILTYGQSQSHGVSRTHGVSSTNCRKLQERIVQTKGYLFYFLSKSRREFTSRRDLNIRPKPKSRREFDQLQEIAGEDSTDQGLSFLFFCRSHAVSSSHGVILTYGKSQSNDVKRGHSYIKVCFVSLIHGMRRNGNMSCVYSLQLNPFEWKN